MSLRWHLKPWHAPFSHPLSCLLIHHFNGPSMLWYYAPVMAFTSCNIIRKLHKSVYENYLHDFEMKKNRSLCPIIPYIAICLTVNMIHRYPLEPAAYIVLVKRPWLSSHDPIGSSGLTDQTPSEIRQYIPASSLCPPHKWQSRFVDVSLSTDIRSIPILCVYTRRDVMNSN
jgi:hypothetical protein